DECMAHINVKLKSDGEFVIHQSSGDEHTLRIAQLKVAMADCVVTEGNVIAISNDGLVALIDGERNKIVGLTLQSPGNGFRNRRHHALEVGVRNAHLSRDGITDSV